MFCRLSEGVSGADIGARGFGLVVVRSFVRCCLLCHRAGPCIAILACIACNAVVGAFESFIPGTLIGQGFKNLVFDAVIIPNSPEESCAETTTDPQAVIPLVVRFSTSQADCSKYNAASFARCPAFRGDRCIRNVEVFVFVFVRVFLLGRTAVARPPVACYSLPGAGCQPARCLPVGKLKCACGIMGTLIHLEDLV
jgi:hypothetical protein